MKIRKKYNYYKIIHKNTVISEVHFNFKQFLFGVDSRTPYITFIHLWFLTVSIHHNTLSYKHRMKYFFDDMLNFSWLNILIGFTFMDKRYFFINVPFFEWFFVIKK